MHHPRLSGVALSRIEMNLHTPWIFIIVSNFCQPLNMWRPTFHSIILILSTSYFTPFCICTVLKSIIYFNAQNNVYLYAFLVKTLATRLIIFESNILHNENNKKNYFCYRRWWELFHRYGHIGERGRFLDINAEFEAITYAETANISYSACRTPTPLVQWILDL